MCVGPRRANKFVRVAIATTSGKILSWKNQPIHAVYHASSGGVIASANEAWAMESVPYLKAKLDGNSDWVNNFVFPIDLSVASAFPLAIHGNSPF